MELKRCWFDVKAEVCFTAEEVDYLIERAKRHYDDACRAAGMSYEDGARETGFIKQLKLFPSTRIGVSWTFRQLDTTLKILEHYAGKDDPMRARLFKEIHSVCDTMVIKHKQLNGAS